MERSVTRLPEPVAFRFFAEFDIQIQPNRLSGLTDHQFTLLQAILASPTTFREFARMSLETDLADLNGCHLSDRFRGPENEEILECVWRCLPDNDRAYWEDVRRREPGDAVAEIMPVMFAFQVTLRGTGIEELPSEPEPIRKVVRPTLVLPND